MKKLFMPFDNGILRLKNHIVMAPMTRSRAIGNIPNELMATYYRQRSGAGLIITEGTSPSPEGLGYPRIPGIFLKEQVEGWKKVTSAVHEGGSKIFLQLMHTGRIAFIGNLPKGYGPVGMSDIKAAGEIYTDTHGPQEYSQPVALDEAGIRRVVGDFVQAAKMAMEAGFDGVELHGAHGYLLDQSLNPLVNDRRDKWGGTIERRSRLTLEIAEKTVNAIGQEKVGIRISPFLTTNDMPAYDEAEVHQTFVYLTTALNKLGIAYLHISQNPAIPPRTHSAIRNAFSHAMIYCNGLTTDTAEQMLQNKTADLVAFGRSFLSNPDLIERMEKNETLNPVDYNTLYTPDAVGYTDYPTLEVVRAH